MQKERGNLNMSSTNITLNISVLEENINMAPTHCGLLL
jgi:hypothetical protein